MAFRVGADENGLGPRLGPLLVTAVLAETRASIKMDSFLGDRLGDSKDLVSHGSIALAEAWSRALVMGGCGKPGVPAEGPAHLVEAFALDSKEVLASRCPETARPQCWHTAHEVFQSKDKDVAQATQDLCDLERRGLGIRAVRSVIVCTDRLNDELKRGRSRLAVDLSAMERLLLALRDIAGEEIQATCGKVGGIMKYVPVFAHFRPEECTVIEERRPRSTYEIARLGRVSFLQDCDATDACVALASLVGKYLREILMARIVEHHRVRDPSLPSASGYYDPVTTTFIRRTRAARKAEGVPPSCFERRTLK